MPYTSAFALWTSESGDTYRPTTCQLSVAMSCNAGLRIQTAFDNKACGVTPAVLGKVAQFGSQGKKGGNLLAELSKGLRVTGLFSLLETLFR